MKRLMLFEANETASEELAADMELRNFSVTRSAMGTGGIARMEAEHPRFDVVVLDMSLDRPVDWETLDQVHRLVVMFAPQSMILCFSTVFRGYRMKRQARRKGARFLYVT